jgi:hypothetical protein
MREHDGLRLFLRLVVAVGLAIDAYVHFDLAAQYDSHVRISQATLFRIEAVAAVVAAILVLAFRRWITDLIAFIVALGGFVAVVLYRYVDVGAFGPFANMYEPIWYGKKTLSAIAELVAALAALPLVLLPQRRAQPSME